MNGLAFSDLSKRFRTNEVLSGVSLDVAPGETVVVFGPSGTGKTVLLRLVAGIEEPDAGVIEVAGCDVTDASPERRGVGMAFQNFALFPHMTAFDNVASGLTASQASAEERARKVHQVAGLLKIDHVLSHAPRELSNGQKQRTALARALVAEPKVLLLDDPLRNVDAKLRYEMRLELPNLLRRFGSSVLYVTQDYREAMALGDRIAVLLGGRFAQVARPEEIYAKPATVEVAKLFGDPTINLVPVDLARDGAGVSVAFAGTRVDLGTAYAGLAGRSATLGLRPEDIAIGDHDGPGAIPVEVVAVTPLNEKAVMLLKTDDGRELFAAASGEALGTRAHGPAFMRFDPAAALIFEAESGRRIDPRLH